MKPTMLIPLNKRSKEEARKIQRMGGLAKSEAKTIANCTKNLKTGRYAKKFSLMVQNLAKSPETSALKIFALIEGIQKDWAILNPKLKMDLARLYCEAHRTLHGTKQLNVNINSELKRDLEVWFSNNEGDEQNERT